MTKQNEKRMQEELGKLRKERDELTAEFQTSSREASHLRQELKEQTQSGRQFIAVLVHELRPSDILLGTGFLCSLLTMGMTLYFLAQSGFTETNPYLAKLLDIAGHHLTILMFGVVWACIFIAYYLLRGTVYAMYIAFLAFSLFAFNLAHDLGTVLGAW